MLKLNQNEHCRFIKTRLLLPSFTFVLFVLFFYCAVKMFLLENNTIDIGEVDVGRRTIQDVPPGR